MSWQAGTNLDGRFRLEAKIGEGGMGEVWRARHLALDSDVAIKFLGTQLATNEEVRERFRHEAQITAKLRSRNAVQVFDFGVSEGEPYLVMELLHGETLARRIEREVRLSPTTTVSLLRDAARALGKAHTLGIVHRDFKPENVFLTDSDGQVEVKVVDFGIAKLIGSLEATRPLDVDLSLMKDKGHLTRTGRMVGTPHYMGPEQVRMDADIGAAADIWALGVVAYECLTGRCPFDGDNVLELFTNIQLYKWKPATVVVPGLPASFDDWFRTVCALEPGDRFADPNVAVDALAVALHLDMPRDMNSDGSRLRNDSLAEGLMPIIAYTNPTTENLLDMGGGSLSKSTLLNAAVSVEPKKRSRGPWVIVAASCLALAGLSVARLPHVGRTRSPVAAAAPHKNPEMLVTSGDDAGTVLSSEREGNGLPSVNASAPAIIRPEPPLASATPDAGSAASPAVHRSPSHPSSREPSSSSLPPSGAGGAPSPAPSPVTPAPASSPAASSNANTPFKNPALGF